MYTEIVKNNNSLLHYLLHFLEYCYDMKFFFFIAFLVLIGSLHD